MSKTLVFPPVGLETLKAHFAAYSIPARALVLYLETSGFTSANSVVIDHAVAFVDLKEAKPLINTLSSGLLTWGPQDLPEQIATRLRRDTEAIANSRFDGGARVYPYDADDLCLQHGNGSGPQLMTEIGEMVAEAISSNTPIVAHGFLSFYWQFISPYVTAAMHEEVDSNTLLRVVFETSFVEKLRQSGYSAEGFSRPGSMRLDEWQRLAASVVSKAPWSIRRHMLKTYGLDEPVDSQYCIDMLEHYVQILQLWRSLSA